MVSSEISDTQLDDLLSADSPLQFYQQLLYKLREALYLSADGSSSVPLADGSELSFETRQESLDAVNQIEEKIRMLRGQRRKPFFSFSNLGGS